MLSIILYKMTLTLDKKIFTYFNTTTNIRSKKYLHKTEWDQNKSFSKKGFLLKSEMSINVDKMSINDKKKAEKGRDSEVQKNTTILCKDNYFNSNSIIFENINWEHWNISEIGTYVISNKNEAKNILYDFIGDLIKEKDKVPICKEIDEDSEDSIKVTITKSYHCSTCNYYCDYASKLERHYATKKHKINENQLSESNKIITTTPSRNNNVEVELVNNLIKQNQEFKEMIVELTKSSTNTVNNTINGNVNKFNINIFLNENCNDAINFKDFIENLEVSKNDLENNAQLGFVNGISKIILDNLRQMSIHERPIHCTDIKRETMYIKDENEWHRDEDGNKIKKGIQEVSRKSMETLNEWKETNPDYNDIDSDFSNKCITIQQQSNAGSRREEYYPKIVKSVAKETSIRKSKLIKSTGEDKSVRS